MRAAITCALALCLCAPAHAAKPLVGVGELDSEKTCTLYKLTSGRHREAAAVDGYVGVYASETTWRDYLVRDCVDHFASLRTSIEAALASSGALTVSPSGRGAFVVSGRISEVSGGGPADPTAPAGDGGFAISSSKMVVNMDVSVRDPSGRIVYGGLLTKNIETGFSMDTPGLSSSSTHSGKAIYTELQHQVALAVARLVTFKIAPLRVSSVSGNHIQLNYGSPLLTMGTLVQVSAPDGSLLRYNVTGAGTGSSEAEYTGDGNTAAITPGNIAMVIEGEDPAANGRRFQRVDLP